MWLSKPSSVIGFSLKELLYGSACRKCMCPEKRIHGRALAVSTDVRIPVEVGHRFRREVGH
jgi:hypothetical protein